MKKSFRIIKFKKNKPALQVKGVSKSFSGRPVLKKINLLKSNFMKIKLNQIKQ